MNSRILIIHEYQILYQVLNEISEGLNCEIIQSSNKNFKELKFDTKNNYLIISKKKIEGVKNSLILDNLPIKLEKLIEMINDFLHTIKIPLFIFSINTFGRRLY